MQTTHAEQAALSRASEAERWLAAAKSVQSSLQDLMQQAQALHTQGLPDRAATLYETWINHSESPLRHVACFNWGTMLTAAGQNEAAEAAYQRALALDSSGHPVISYWDYSNANLKLVTCGNATCTSGNTNIA